jgi:hypothetical protein
MTRARLAFRPCAGDELFSLVSKLPLLPMLCLQQTPPPNLASLVQFVEIKDYSFFLGAQFLVVPMLVENATTVQVTFPSSGTYR